MSFEKDALRHAETLAGPEAIKIVTVTEELAVTSDFHR
jgi:hypothetical protein